MKIEEEIDGRFRNEYHKGVVNLIYTSNKLHYNFIKYLKSVGLSSQQYNVLKILRGFGDKPLTIDFIRKRMLDKHSDISRIVDRLHKKELLERTESKIDRRQKNIVISEKGLDLLKTIDATEKKVDELLKNLTLEEVELLNNLLNKIRE